MINTHGGGAQTNKNGLKFEQDTSLHTAIVNAGFATTKISKGNNSVSTHKIYDNDAEIGIITSKQQMYKYVLEPMGVDFKKCISKQLQPDDAYISHKNKEVCIIEKKFQSTSGSVDEKLQTCDYKKWEYEKLWKPLGYNVRYIYVLNDWFQKPEYRDVLEYITMKGCEYYFNEIPVENIIY